MSDSRLSAREDSESWSSERRGPVFRAPGLTRSATDLAEEGRTAFLLLRTAGPGLTPSLSTTLVHSATAADAAARRLATSASTQRFSTMRSRRVAINTRWSRKRLACSPKDSAPSVPVGDEAISWSGSSERPGSVLPGGLVTLLFPTPPSSECGTTAPHATLTPELELSSA